MSTLSHQEARQTYDRIGPLQDSPGFYEDRATSLVLQHGDFSAAQSIFEFGCGTGRFAQRLFEQGLAGTAHYRGTDVSPRMVSLARKRLEPYSLQAEVVLSEGDPPLGEAAAGFDRFISNYVFDLLSHEDILAVLREAHRMLREDGLLCLSGISTGTGRVSRMVMGMVSWVQSVHPSLVGGCRPVDLLPLLPPSQWKVQYHTKVVAFGIASEVLIARRC